jgi:4-amino-4-deoxy-L-arabinose transferase-like glycosyltransferase
MRRALDWICNTRGGLLAVWAAYLLPRLAICLLNVTPTSDADWYVHRAIELAAGRGYLSIHGLPTAYWPPGWPMVLSLGFRVFGPSFLAIKLLNLGAAIASGWLVLDLGPRLFGTRSAGRLGLLMLALYPNNIGYLPLGLTEVFYTFLLLLGCWLLIARPGAGAKSAWAWLVLGGLVFGLATLVKAQTLVCVPLILAIELLRGPEGLPTGWKAVLHRVPALAGRFAVIIACAALVVAPWSIRNHRELGQTVILSTNGGITLLTGNCDKCNGGFTPNDPVVNALDARTDLSEVGYDREAKRLGMAWIESHPGRFVAMMPVKLFRLWGPDGEAQWAYETGYPGFSANVMLFRALRGANQLWYWSLLLGAGMAGIAIIRQRRLEKRNWVDWWLLPYCIIAYLSGVAMVFSGQTRFHYPAMPLVCLACGWLLAHLLGEDEVPAAEEAAAEDHTPAVLDAAA